MANLISFYAQEYKYCLAFSLIPVATGAGGSGLLAWGIIQNDPIYSIVGGIILGGSIAACPLVSWIALKAKKIVNLSTENQTQQQRIIELNAEVNKLKKNSNYQNDRSESMTINSNIEAYSFEEGIGNLESEIGLSHSIDMDPGE